MNKTKRIIIGCAAAAVAVACIAVGARFMPKKAAETPTEETTEKYEYTTLVPFAPAQTEILTPTTTRPLPELTTRYEENASRLSEEQGWKGNDLTLGLPEIRSGSVSTVNYVTDKGNRTVIRIDSFDYNSYLNYIQRLEEAGFTDNNGKAHIPSAAPSTVAMFYSRFDGSRSFGVYWYGSDSDAGFDCEIVVSDYDQAK